MVKALITEQLDSNGALKTLQMKPGQQEHMVVAFAHEYDEPKRGPSIFCIPTISVGIGRASRTAARGFFQKRIFGRVATSST
jgi:hypothetical protein